MSGKREVRALKIPLAILAIGLAVVLFLLSGDGPQRLNLTIGVDEPTASKKVERAASRARTRLRESQLEDVAATTMISPRFIGEDNRTGKWELTARKAHQKQLEGGDKFELERVQATAINNRGVSVTFIAEEGYYDQAEQRLSLKKEVVVGGYGFRLETEELVSSIVSRTAWTTRPVNITSQYGAISSHAMRMEENGDHLIFKENVEGIFYLPDSEATVDVSSEALDVMQNKGYAVFNEDVHVSHDGMEMDSDILHIYFAADTDDVVDEGKNSEAVNRAEAEGNVEIKLSDKNEIARGDKAVFDPEKHTLTVSENVTLTSGENVLQGSLLVYNLKTKQFSLKAGKKEGGRIKAHIEPEKVK